MLISVIVVTFNEAAVLPEVFAALHRMKRPVGGELETILIDGGSRDGTPDTARRLGFSEVIELPGAPIPVCRNAGLRAAAGEWVAFVDGDCVLDPDWLTHAARLLQTHKPLILGWPAAPPSPGTWVQRAWYAHWMHKNPRIDMIEGESVVQHEGFRLITTRNMICHREVAETIGGFNEDLATGEDTDFVFRASMAGIPVWGLPALKATHLGEPATLGKFFRQQLWHANRKAYATILSRSGMKAGGNAPLFTLLFIVTLQLAGLTALGGFFFPWLWLGMIPFPAMLTMLATRTAFRARKPMLIPALIVLYTAYGLARSLDFIGLSPRKPSWKTGKA